MIGHPSGSTIGGQYEVVIGPAENPSLQGGFGQVYFCTDHAQDGRPVALKTFRPEFLSRRRVRDAFLREGTVWIGLGHHPHIVPAYEVLRVGDGREVYVVIEWIAAAEGKKDPSLRGWLEVAGRLPPKEALLLGLGIARGMKHVVGRVPGLIHRDLKPENVLIGRDQRVRVTDFGLAAVLGEGVNETEEQEANSESDSALWQGRSLSVKGRFVGTPEYAAPEQFVGGDVDLRADIYALGCVLYEVVQGQRPFVVEHRDQKVEEVFAEFARRHQEEEVVWDRRGDTALEQVVRRCLAKQPQERYAEWEEVEAALAEAYREEVKEAPPEEERSERQSTRAERMTVGWSHNALGISYMDLGKAQVAVRYFERVVQVGRAEVDREMEGAGLGNLGNAWADLGDARRAIGFFEQCLAIAREIGNRRGEGSALGNLGHALAALGDAKRAIGFFEQHLAIAREIRDRRGEGGALGNLGAAWAHVGDAKRAIGFFEQRLAIAREIRDRRGEGDALGNLGIAWLNLGDAKRAIGFFEQFLVIAREIGNRRGEGIALGSLGSAWAALGNAKRAIGFYEQELAISREIRDREGEGTTLGNLGIAWTRLGDAKRAIEFFEQRLVITRERGDQAGEATGRLNLAILLAQQGERDQAREHALAALRFFEQIGHAKYAARVKNLLSQL